MGNHSNGEIQPDSFEVLFEEQTGEVVREKATNWIYFVRSLSLTDESSYRDVLSTLKSYLSHQPCSEVLKLVRIHPQQQNSICGSMYKIVLYFEYSSVCLLDEVMARVQTHNYFDFEDVLSIVQGSINALHQISVQLRQYGFRYYSIFAQVFVTPSRILLNEEGNIKVMSPLMVSPVDRCTRKHRTYYSPEKLSDFNFEDDQKSAIFELGVTLLHLITLKDCKGIYNGFEVKQDEISHRIEEIRKIYNSPPLCELLAKMTSTLRSKRADVEQSRSLANSINEGFLTTVTTVKSIMASEEKGSSSENSNGSINRNINGNINGNTNRNTNGKMNGNINGNINENTNGNINPQNCSSVIVQGMKPLHFLAAFRSSLEESNGTADSYQYGQELKDGLFIDYQSRSRMESKVRFPPAISRSIRMACREVSTFDGYD